MIKCFLWARCGALTINPNKQVDLCECNGSLVYIAQANPGEWGGEGEKDEMGGEKHKESLLILFGCVCSCYGTCVESEDSCRNQFTPSPCCVCRAELSQQA